MAINKIVFNDRVLIDLTDSTVTPETLLEGVVAYNAAGERIVGTMKKGADVSLSSDGNGTVTVNGATLESDGAGTVTAKGATLTGDSAGTVTIGG